MSLSSAQDLDLVDEGVVLEDDEVVDLGAVNLGLRAMKLASSPSPQSQCLCGKARPIFSTNCLSQSAGGTGGGSLIVSPSPS